MDPFESSIATDRLDRRVSASKAARPIEQFAAVGVVMCSAIRSYVHVRSGCSRVGTFQHFIRCNEWHPFVDQEPAGSRKDALLPGDTGGNQERVLDFWLRLDAALELLADLLSQGCETLSRWKRKGKLVCNRIKRVKGHGHFPPWPRGRNERNPVLTQVKVSTPVLRAAEQQYLAVEVRNNGPVGQGVGLYPVVLFAVPIVESVENRWSVFKPYRERRRGLYVVIVMLAIFDDDRTTALSHSRDRKAKRLATLEARDRDSGQRIHRMPE